MTVALTRLRRPFFAKCSARPMTSAALKDAAHAYTNPGAAYGGGQILKL